MKDKHVKTPSGNQHNGHSTDGDKHAGKTALAETGTLEMERIATTRKNCAGCRLNW